MNYKDQIKHPKWQKKRLEILNRDGFQCRSCLNREEMLVVHHLEYHKGKMIWEYENEYLITICDGCHESVHYQIDNKMYENELLYFYGGYNPIFVDIYKRRLLSFMSQRGASGIIELIQFITSCIITEEEI